MRTFSRSQKISVLLLSSAMLLAGTVACVKNLDRRSVNPSKVVHFSYLFDHQRHTPVIQSMGLDCLSCHPKQEALRVVVKGNKTGQRSKCHDCHRNPAMWGAASQRCEVCHTDLGAVRPADHRLNWEDRHALFARLDEFQCANCHDRSSCTDCHVQRDPIQQTVHPRPFLYYHSVQARAKPHSCGSCHRINFCQDCHVGKGITF